MDVNKSSYSQIPNQKVSISLSIISFPCLKGIDFMFWFIITQWLCLNILNLCYLFNDWVLHQYYVSDLARWSEFKSVLRFLRLPSIAESWNIHDQSCRKLYSKPFQISLPKANLIQCTRPKKQRLLCKYVIKPSTTKHKRFHKAGNAWLRRC